MEIKGYYQNGVIVPDQDFSLPEGAKVTIIFHTPSDESRETMTKEVRSRYLAALARIDGIRDEQPDDSLSGADHDRVLYGDGA